MTNKLNKGQQNAVDAFLGFLASDKKYFVLTGGAGVGKTTTIQAILNSLEDFQEVLALLDKKKLNEVIVTATTNKAAEVIGKSLQKPATTIHSALAIRVINDYRTGKTKLSLQAAKPLYNALVIIDEASMVDSDLLNAINNLCINCKIVFVGDIRQLAPVGETNSPAFSLPNCETIYLTEPVRNAHNAALKNLCKQLETTVDTGKFIPIQPVAGSIDYLTNSQMESTLENVMGTFTPESRIICYTNKRVITYNNHMRYVLGLPKTFQEGELVVSGNTTTTKHSKLFPEQELIIQSVDTEATINSQLLDEYGLELYTRNVETSVGNFTIAESNEALTKLIKITASNKNWPAYFYLKERIADFRMPHACTAYKAQGSTYKSVFIDLADISMCRDDAQLARMLYVAVSRATDRIYLYGSLPARLFK